MMAEPVGNHHPHSWTLRFQLHQQLEGEGLEKCSILHRIEPLHTAVLAYVEHCKQAFMRDRLDSCIGFWPEAGKP